MQETPSKSPPRGGTLRNVLKPSRKGGLGGVNQSTQIWYKEPIPQVF